MQLDAVERRAAPRGGWSGEGPARARAEEGVPGWLRQEGALPPAQVFSWRNPLEGRWGLLGRCLAGQYLRFVGGVSGLGAE